MQRKTNSKANNEGVRTASLPKSLTGIQGFDQITGGGLPKGRPTLVCGSAGSGKTLLAMEFLVRGAINYNEPGVFIAFEENSEELTKNVASLGFDLEALSRKKKIVVDYVYIERSEIEETGEYDLEGLFIRLNHAIQSIGAKRVVLDTIESLFSGLPNHNILRAELRRLFRWLKERGVTAIVTAERGEGTLTRHGLEEYVADCVIMLDHRVTQQISTRRLRIVKYRGSIHGTNEYPFLIDDNGISVLPLTSVGLEHKASSERISTGIFRLDAMLEGKGYYRGSTVLVSGTAGTGKTSFAISFVRETCKRGERCLYFASEESMSDIMRNGLSIGINLQPYTKKGLLRFSASRPTAFGLEMHLATIHKLVNEFAPSVVVMDPISNFMGIADTEEVNSMILRLIDLMKFRQITVLCTDLTQGGHNLDQTEIGVSSLMDTWIVLKDLEYNGERTRGIYVLKSRGMAHSNQIREVSISDRGVDLLDVYAGSGTVLMGTARISQESKEKIDELVRGQEIERRQREFEAKKKETEARIEALRAAFAAEEAGLKQLRLQEELRKKTSMQVMAELGQIRGMDKPVQGNKKRADK